LLFRLMYSWLNEFLELVSKKGLVMLVMDSLLLLVVTKVGKVLFLFMVIVIMLDCFDFVMCSDCLFVLKLFIWCDFKSTLCILMSVNLESIKMMSMVKIRSVF